MLKKTINIRSLEDAQTEFEKFRSTANSSKLGVASKNLMLDQVQETIRQYETQLALENVRHVKATRVLEGDGYAVKINVDNQPSGLVQFIRKLLGAR